MTPEKDGEFEQSMHELIQLLKKMLKNIPQGSWPHPFSQAKDGPVQFNFFFTFLPMDAEEMDEFEEIYEQYLAQEDRWEDFSGDLSDADRDFLRRHGIRF